MPENSNCITPPTHSFVGLPVCTQLKDLEADIAIIGLHYVSPYPLHWYNGPSAAKLENEPK